MRGRGEWRPVLPRLSQNQTKDSLRLVNQAARRNQNSSDSPDVFTATGRLCSTRALRPTRCSQTFCSSVESGRGGERVDLSRGAGCRLGSFVLRKKKKGYFLLKKQGISKLFACHITLSLSHRSGVEVAWAHHPFVFLCRDLCVLFTVV